jgi:hypothetical protein
MMIFGKKEAFNTPKDIKPAVMTVGGLTPKIYTVLKYLPNRENQ